MVCFLLESVGNSEDQEAVAFETALGCFDGLEETRKRCFLEVPGENC